MTETTTASRINHDQTGPMAELRALPALQRRVLYTSLFMMSGIFLAFIVVVPLVLLRYGWGPAGGLVDATPTGSGGSTLGFVWSEVWRLSLTALVVPVPLAWAWLIKKMGPI